VGGITIEDEVARAAAARRAGRLPEAETLLRGVLTSKGDNPAVLNGLGLVLIDQRRGEEAVAIFRRAIAIDQSAPPLWMNLAEAARLGSLPAEELAALDGALAIDPYLLPALLKKAQVLERLDRGEESAACYRALLATTPDDSGLPEPVRAALAHGREVIEAAGDRRIRQMSGALDGVRAAFPDESFDRARIYIEQRAGRRPIYQPQPTAGHFPFLPTPEYFDPALFPWFDRLEQATDIFTAELRMLLAGQRDVFRPYVAFGSTEPVNQWAELNHSDRWSSWFFWKDGVRQDANLAACPRSAELLASLPLLDIAGKAPSVMFSVLAPRTRIPAHHGSSNVRVTVHLPLIVPPGCGFRVGGETREWREGKAWAFDDTIEHEAWNDSDQPRIILILDAWNPYLTEAERAAVRVVG
jgi:aspartate beta-hydroxylase